MDWPTILFLVVVGLVALVALELCERWWVRRMGRKLLREAMEMAERGETSTPLMPESQYAVEISDDGVLCSSPDGTTESVQWDDLQAVEVLTTDEGPFLPDQFWVLHGSTQGCVIPWGATGERELLRRLQELPGFRNEAIVEASSLTENNRLLCWLRESHNSQ